MEYKRLTKWNKQKQIEEMKKDIDNSGVFFTSDTYLIAKAVIELGYRKIPEGAVVLTQEEWEGYCATQESLGEIMETERQIARKETAEKFAEKVLALFASDMKITAVSRWTILRICKEITESK